MSIRVIGKTSYVGHRRFLPSNHAMRRDIRFDGKVERRPPPRRFTCEEILSQVNALEPQNPGHHEDFGGVKCRRVVETSNWRKKKFVKGIKFPDGFCSNLKSKVSPDESNIIGLKSHDCHVIMQRVLAVGVRKFLPRDTATTITQLSFFDIMIHLVLHLPEEAILGGLIFMRWMYPFERYMKKLKNYVGNKARPEGSIAEGYVADEAVTFCSMYFKGCKTRFNRLDRNEDAPSVSRYLSVFNSQSRPWTSGIIKPLDRIGREKAEWYILQSSPEIQAYLDEHLEKIRHEYPNGNHVVLHRQTFRPWFHKKIYELHKLGTLQNGDELLALASGSDYLATFYEDEPYILANQAKQVFYLEDPLRGRDWKVVEDISHRQFWDINDNEDETDVDVVNDSNSSNFVLTVDLGELIWLSNEPPVIVESSDQLVDSEIENNELDENYAAEEVDDLLVEHVEDENENLVNDGNDSDSSV
ncbi:uncharacterized protein LOC133036031 [Cannabis sativa]|uniref:uncharacterized protein LOC133036031 n=1 Tax=Cannabis sativa TaxID=3483 RepID=UPI0029CA87A9|nr:uncharacterized protein LOC133036031 [Cannabis sativa]